MKCNRESEISTVALSSPSKRIKSSASRTASQPSRQVNQRQYHDDEASDENGQHPYPVNDAATISSPVPEAEQCDLDVGDETTEWHPTSPGSANVSASTTHDLTKTKQREQQEMRVDEKSSDDDRSEGQVLDDAAPTDQVFL